MKYQVIARKFRPQVFEDVVGQKPIVQTLQNAIQLNRVGHAYLFSGPRGVGKTTTARLLAKALNCVHGPSIAPCNQCPSCLEIAAGQSMDVLEIDAASNTGVDNIRELRESARYAPSRDRYKIFIIDEVHMLSTSAFNALLKILEEPPPHIVFIMATTERHKLPATILSRCQQFVFRTISPHEIHERLRKIADQENVKIDDRALSYLVRASEGSMRDAQSLLDQIISFGGQDIAGEDVRDVLGFIPSEILDNTLEALGDRDSKSLLDNIGIVIDQGLSVQQYVREFVGRVRDLLLMKLGLDDKLIGSPAEKQALKVRADRFSEQDLIRYFDMLLRLESDLRYTAQPRFQAEVGFVKMAKIGYLRDIEDVLRDLQQGGGPSPTGRTGPADPSKTTPNVGKAGGPAPEKPKSAAPGSEASFRDAFIDCVSARSATTGVHLERAVEIGKTDAGVQIVMGNANHHALLDSKDHRAVLEAAAAEAIGRPVPVSLVVRSTNDQSSSAAAASPAPKPPVESRSEPAREPVKFETTNGADTKKAMESARDEPLVKRFLEVFRGDIAQVKPVKGEQS